MNDPSITIALETILCFILIPALVAIPFAACLLKWEERKERHHHHFDETGV